MPDLFIIDEWLWSDLNGENGEENQKEAFSFLKKLCEKCDGIAVAIDSKFTEKERNFSKNAHKDIKKRKIAQFYFYKIRLNSLKYKEINIEQEYKNNLNINELNIDLDDVYLVKTYFKVKVPVITTDTKLKEKLDHYNIPCKLRDAFLRDYLK